MTKARGALAQIIKSMRSLGSDTGASALPFVVLILIVASGMAAVSVDLTFAYQSRSQLLTIAEASALAAASALPDHDAAMVLALQYAGYNQNDSIYQGAVERADVQFGAWDEDTLTFTASESIFEAVRVTASLNETKDNAIPSIFSNLFGRESFELEAVSVASLIPPSMSNLCVMALHPTQPGAINFSGNSTVRMGCGVGSNSNAPDSIIGSGSATVYVTEVRTVGGISDSGQIDPSATIVTGSGPIVDPYRNLDIPDFSGCDYTNFRASDTAVLNPGVYCGELRINSFANVTLNAGNYILDDAELRINAQSTVTGNDVTFFFTNSVDPTAPQHPHINGGAEIHLSAPTTGPYASILMMQDPNAADTIGSEEDRWRVNGNSRSELNGVIYAPNTLVFFTGTADLDQGCVQIVAGVVTFSGDFELNQGCDPSPYAEVQMGGGTGLVRLER